jgi:hypothetical protein
MISRRTAIVAAALVAAAFGGSAQAAAPPATQLASVEEVAFEQAMSTAGKPLGPKLLVARKEYALDAAVAASSPPTERSLAGKPRRYLQGSGCKTVWAARIGRSVLGFTLWKYTQEKYFCWSYPKLTNVQTNAYPCCTDPTWHWVRQIGSSGWFFSWAGSSQGGHYTFRQGRFEQTLAGKLLDSAQPWVKIWVYGDGSWSYSTGS